MSASRQLTRRDALKLTALAAVGLPLLNPFRAAAEELHVPPLSQSQTDALKLGVASISLAKYSPDDAIAALKKFEIRYVSLFRTHCPWNGTAEECRAAAKKFTDAGLTVTGSGVIDLPNNEATVRKAFENARAAGLPKMICKPALNAYPLVEKFVKEYDIKLAVHNHGPEDNVYPSPYIAWKAIEPYDSRIGMCIDVGHCARAGVDPIEAIHKCHTRLYDIHLKDSLAQAGSKKDVPMEVGRGKLDIKGILNALIQVKYPNIVAFEYEKGGADPRVGLGESIAYVRKCFSEMRS